MIGRVSVAIQSFSDAPSSSGKPVRTFAALKTIKAGVQAVQLNEVQLAAFGVSQAQANAKKMFFDPDPAIRELYRALIGGLTYEIRGINQWAAHSVALLIPITGEAIKTFCMSLDPARLSGYSYVWDDGAKWYDVAVWYD